MKFGSVKFFKRLIMVVFLLLVLAPAVLAVVFGTMYGREKKRADWLETVNWAMLNGAEWPEDFDDGGEIAQYMQQLPHNFAIKPSFDYQLAYPELYYNRPEQVPDTPGEKICYLTFDDGPSPVTMQVLKTLKDNGIKATFFVTGPGSVENEEALRQAAREGHAIGVHTYSHDYVQIYGSVENYLADFDAMYRRVVEVTGTPPGIFRFAGGSINAYNAHVYDEIIAEMTRRGFTFYDWNASGEDSVQGGASRSAIVENVLNSAAGRDKLVVLLHDRQDNTTTAAALPDIIEALQQQGYRFETLRAEVPPVTYFYPG